MIIFPRLTNLYHSQTFSSSSNRFMKFAIMPAATFINHLWAWKAKSSTLKICFTPLQKSQFVVSFKQVSNIGKSKGGSMQISIFALISNSYKLPARQLQVPRFASNAIIIHILSNLNKMSFLSWSASVNYLMIDLYDNFFFCLNI